MLNTIILPLVRLAVFTVLVQGVFLWLEQSHQIYVYRWVAAMIGAVESVAVQAPSWVGWTLAGIVGLLATTIWEIVRYRGWFPWRSVRPAGDVSQRDVWLSDAMIYVLRGRWGDKIDPTNTSENELSRFYEIEKEFRQAALDGTLPIWGKRAAYRLWEEVLAEDWASYDFDEFDLLKSLADPKKLIVVRVGGRFSTQEWVRVMTSKAKVEELWPI